MVDHHAASLVSGARAPAPSATAATPQISPTGSHQVGRVFGKRRADSTHRCRPGRDQTNVEGQGPTAEHPTITFRSTHVTGTPQSFEITGDLTVKGRTRPVTVYGKVNGDRMLHGWVITRGIEPHTPRSWAHCGWPTRSEWSSE
ncbi:YceI family protein [Streptomyces sp. NPDC056910]|uniref:YceI family protein n=1 Tax=Streptomyces sp. NPDC056910 TaxID=3345964 RepID=UPI0036CC4573